jgi:hypothetical protein
MFGAARRRHHRQQEQMRRETAERNAREAHERAMRSQQEALERMRQEALEQNRQMIQEFQRSYQAQAEATIEAGRMQIQQMEDEKAQRAAADKLQQQLTIQSNVSKARGGQQASLQIAPQQTEKTAGTQAFRRRRDQFRLAPIQSTAGVNVPSGSVLNV